MNPDEPRPYDALLRPANIDIALKHAVFQLVTSRMHANSQHPILHKYAHVVDCQQYPKNSQYVHPGHHLTSMV